MKHAAAENRILTKYSAAEMDMPMMSFQGSIIIHQPPPSMFEIYFLKSAHTAFPPVFPSMKMKLPK